MSGCFQRGQPHLEDKEKVACDSRLWKTVFLYHRSQQIFIASLNLNIGFLFLLAFFHLKNIRCLYGATPKCCVLARPVINVVQVRGVLLQRGNSASLPKS